MAATPAKSLILDLLATLKPGSVMPIGALVEAGALFGVSGNNIRVSAARLLADGQIARDERGRYRLGERSAPIGNRVRSWRGLDRRTRTWGGGWISVLTSRVGRVAARRRERALRLLGFRRWRDGLWIRPDNLIPPLDDVRGELFELGLPAGDVVCRMGDFCAGDYETVCSLWDVEVMVEEHRRLRREIELGAARLPSLAVEEAMVESFLLGGRALRQLVNDPLLPEEICPSGERIALLSSMRAYDRLGRLAWSELLKRWEVPNLRAPLNGRSESERLRLVV